MKYTIEECEAVVNDNEILWGGGNYFKTTGKVVLCHPDIGITIVSAKDPAEKITCINGPMSPNKKEYEQIKIQYENMFEKAMEMILCGHYRPDDNEAGDYSPLGVPMAPCATGL